MDRKRNGTDDDKRRELKAKGCLLSSESSCWLLVSLQPLSQPLVPPSPLPSSPEGVREPSERRAEGNEGGSVVVSPSPHLTLSSFGSVRFCCHSTSPGSLGSLATLVSRREPTRCAERKGRRGTRQREPGNSQINPEIAAFVTSNDK